MHPWPSCNGRTRNAVSMIIWVCTRPHYFRCPSPDFTTSIVSQSVTNNRCAPSCGGGTREKWGGTSKFFRPVCPPLANCFRRHCHHYLRLSEGYVLPGVFCVFVCLSLCVLFSFAFLTAWVCSLLMNIIDGQAIRLPVPCFYSKTGFGFWRV